MTTDTSLEILIADDDRVPRRLLRRMLERWGHRVIEVENGLQAWQALNVESPPHIAILDWMMPGIDGIELCRRLDQRVDAPLVYTILSTSKRDESDLVHALDNGAHDFQSKPISPGELQARLAVGRRLVEMHDRLQASLSEMERLATTDVLTGIANRRHFYACANRALDQAGTRGNTVSTLLLDVDRFKEINDRYGHSAGDSALCQIATLCQGLLRPTDMVARFGGDEIVILLPNTLLDEAVTIAERLRLTIANTALCLENRDPAKLSVSIGCASSSASGIGIDELLGRADAALLKAKSEGRNRVVSDSGTTQSSQPLGSV